MTTTEIFRLVLVTNFEYEAKGRDYAKEDLYLSAEFRKRGCQVVTIHPNDLEEGDFSGSNHVLWRNTGPVTTHKASLDRWRFFQANGRDNGKLVNNLQLNGDLRGKQHLIELTALGGFPVIKTVPVRSFLSDRRSDSPDEDVLIKPIDGADSIGQQVLRASQLAVLAIEPGSGLLDGFVAQPVISFDYEVSFYFVEDCFAYALRTGGPSGRWELVPYVQADNTKTWDEDLAFARRFVEWNGTSRGVVRVDGVRESSSGSLLLMEIEDYNPYLSLDLLPAAARSEFVDLLFSRMARDDRLVHGPGASKKPPI